MEDTAQGTSPDRSPPTIPEIRSLITDTIQQTLPMLLKEALKDVVPLQQLNTSQLPDPSQLHSTTQSPFSTATAVATEDDPLETPHLNSRLAKYYTETTEAQLSEEVTTFLTTAFTKRLSKNVWSELMQKYPPIKGMDEVLVAPTMETGTREHIKQKFGYHKTKEVFASDDGLVERQGPFLAVAQPLAPALESLEGPSAMEEGDEISGPDPDEIKAYLEDALVLLGNANFWLNAWRQKRFTEYLTDVGKRILKEDIPTDKHLFPDKFHQVVQSEHDHSKTNSKVIAAPPKPAFQKESSKQPFRTYATPTSSGPRRWGKRKWPYKASGSHTTDYARPTSTRPSFAKRPRASKDPNSSHSAS